MFAPTLLARRPLVEQKTPETPETGETGGRNPATNTDETPATQRSLRPLKRKRVPVRGGSRGERKEFEGAASNTEWVQPIINRLIQATGSASRSWFGGVNEIRIDEAKLRKLVQKTRTVVMKQPVFLQVDAPIRIVGDIHGQFPDLLRIFQENGHPPETKYLFLGDYVDRGKQSMETITLLFAYKVRYPDNFFLLRGNHEDASINRIYGFYDECKRRYSVRLWKMFCDCFNCLPVVGLVGSKILCMHGGLSPELRSLQQLREITRPTTIPPDGLLCDLLWADPSAEITGWRENFRGVSYCFGSDVLPVLCKKLNIDLVCRAHQVVEDGYEFFGARKLVTVFSAPNYAGEFDNDGAVMCVAANLKCSFNRLNGTGR